MKKRKTIPARPLTAAEFAPFGHVVSVADGGPSRPVNRGTAELVEHLGHLQNLRPNTARENLKLYQCTPKPLRPVPILDLEKHPYSSQLFCPLGPGSSYLVVVAHGAETPDLDSLAAFIASNTQGIIYHPAVWHQPMTVLEQPQNMFSIVFEDGSPNDCTVIELDRGIAVAF